MTSRLLASTVILLSLSGHVWSQPPRISVFPDSINLEIEFQGTRVDSFRIANVGSDTLRYRMTWNPRLDTSWYYNSLLTYTPITVDSLLRASVFSPRWDFMLLEFKYPLLVQNPTHIEFFLFESSSLTGNYHRIFSTMQLVDSSTFNGFVSSGPLSLRIRVAHYYAIGVAWDHPVQYRSPGGAGFSSDGLGLAFHGNLLQAHTFPSDTSLVVPDIPYSSGYDMGITGGIALWLQLLTDSTGMVEAGHNSVVPFVARDPGFFGHSQLTSYFSVYSNDPIDSIKRVAVSRHVLTGVDRLDIGISTQYELRQNFPNPFNPNTTIRFSLPRATSVSLKVYDVLGRDVATLVSGHLEAGVHQLSWNADAAASGVYFYRLHGPTGVLTKRMLLLK